MYKANEQVSSMSMRQQILYIMQMSSRTQTEWDNDGKLVAQAVSVIHLIFSIDMHQKVNCLFYGSDDIAYINPNERYE